MEAGKENSGGVGTRRSLFPDGGGFRSPIAHQDEPNGLVDVCQEVEGFDEEFVSLERAKASHHSKHEPFVRGGQSELPAQVSKSGGGLKAFRVDSVGNGDELAVPQSVGPKMNAERLGNGMQGGAPLVERTPQVEPARRLLAGVEFRVFPVENGRELGMEAGEPGINQRTEVVRVDDVWAQDENLTVQCP